MGSRDEEAATENTSCKDQHRSSGEGQASELASFLAQEDDQDVADAGPTFRMQGDQGNAAESTLLQDQSSQSESNGKTGPRQSESSDSAGDTESDASSSSSSE